MAGFLIVFLVLSLILFYESLLPDLLMGSFHPPGTRQRLIFISRKGSRFLKNHFLNPKVGLFVSF